MKNNSKTPLFTELTRSEEQVVSGGDKIIVFNNNNERFFGFGFGKKHG